jgi:uncharacterized protein YprB with RNaseH-like and TPR domain
MDIIEKIKRYSLISPTVPDPVQKALHLDELCNQVGGQQLEPLSAPVIRIITEHPYPLFLADPATIFSPIISLPVLSRREFAEPVRLQEIVMFDLETTGLAGGTGTYPFLLGFGIFTEQGIEINQYFLPDFGRETGAYLDLAKSFGGKKLLVSFNGKSFDFPLLNNRFIINRLHNPFKTYRHLDLLHPARRLWKTLLESCSLQNIESHIFKFSRWNDVDSALIPQVYFEFLQHGLVHDIRRVIQHNQQDILTLGHLLFHLHWLENVADEHMFHERELHNLCHVAIANFDLDRSALILERLRRKGNSPSDFTLTAYSLLLKHFDRWQDAEFIWHELIRSGKNTLFAAEELAKYYEHHRKDLLKALVYTEQALEYLEIVDELADTNSYHAERNQFTHRLNRLQRKIAQRGNPVVENPDGLEQQ